MIPKSYEVNLDRYDHGWEASVLDGEGNTNHYAADSLAELFAAIERDYT